MNSSSAAQTRCAALLFRRVGDSLLATAALRAVKQWNPAAQITVFTESHVQRVFAGLEYVDNIVDCGSSPTAFALAGLMRRHGPFEYSMDFLSDPRSALACMLSPARHRAGFQKFPRDLVYTHRVARQDRDGPIYSGLHKLGLARALGAPASDSLPEFHVTPENELVAATLLAERGFTAQSFAAFFVTSRREYKRWPLEDFAQVAHAVRDGFAMKVAVIGNAAERAEIERFTRVANLDPAAHFEFSDLGEMAALLKLARLYVGNDGGPKHLAVAVGTPTLTIFQNDPWEYWTPPDSPQHLAIADAAGRPSAEAAIAGLKRMVSRFGNA